MITWTDGEKAFDKTQHPFYDKNSQQLGMAANHLNLIKKKKIYKNLTANIILMVRNSVISP